MTPPLDKDGEIFYLETDRLRLVPLSPELTLPYWSYHKLNFKYFRDSLPYSSYDEPPEYEEIELAVLQELRMMEMDRAVRFLAFAREDLGMQLPLGDFLVYNIIRGYTDSAHIAYSVDHRHQGNRYCTEICRELINYCFSSLRLYRLEINI
jgi:RimJ/RimL family protein N-acetyltransferase